jgi:hypothetical protein
MLIHVLVAGAADSEGAVVNTTAGDPLLIPATQPITLCTRSDLDPDRFYAGAVANLGIYNTQLTAAQVAAIYRQVTAAVAGAPCTLHIAVSAADGCSIA